MFDRRDSRRPRARDHGVRDKCRANPPSRWVPVWPPSHHARLQPPVLEIRRPDLGRLLLHHAESVPAWVDEDDEVGVIRCLAWVASRAESDESLHLAFLVLGVE